MTFNRRALLSHRQHTGPVQRCRVYAAVVVLAVAGAAAGSAQDVTPEYQLKAAFIAKFPQFTEWPAATFDARETIDICVARPNPFGQALADLVAGQAVRGRDLRAREIGSLANLDSCLLLFVPAQSPAGGNALLAAAQKLPILTVGDSPTFFEQGGMVHLRLVDGRVRFDINVGMADRVGIRFSSQLLRLALNLRGRLP